MPENSAASREEVLGEQCERELLHINRLQKAGPKYGVGGYASVRHLGSITGNKALNRE